MLQHLLQLVVFDPAVCKDHSLGLLLGTEAPDMTPHSIDFSFHSVFLSYKVYSWEQQLLWGCRRSTCGSIWLKLLSYSSEQQPLGQASSVLKSIKSSRTSRQKWLLLKVAPIHLLHYHQNHLHHAYANRPD